MHVPFLKLQEGYQELKLMLDDAWVRVNNRSHYIQGKELESFEQAFSTYQHLNYTVGLGNGLDALIIALRALEIGQGDEVIVPAHTYIATWLAVTSVGATLVPVDIEEDSFNIDASKIESKISPATKAIIPVNLYGRIVDIEAISRVAAQYNLQVVIDAAQSQGVPTVVDKNFHWAYSFYPGKNLGCFGDGGCISTNELNLAQKARMIRNYGSVERYVHKVIGVNSRLDEIQAAVLGVKLQKLDEWNARRHHLVDAYLSALDGVGDLILPKKPADLTHHVWHLFVIRTKRRQELQKYLQNQGIETLIHYPIPPYAQEAYKNLGYTHAEFPVTFKISSEILSLPLGPHMSMSEVEYVVDKIKTFFEN